MTLAAMAAAAQVPDPGTTTNGIYRLADPVGSLLIQPDQRIVVATHGSDLFVMNRSSGIIGRRPGGLFRLHPDGSLDDSFRFAGSAVDYVKQHADGRFLVKASFTGRENDLRDSILFVDSRGGKDPAFQAFRNVTKPPNWWPFASLHSVALEKSGTVAVPPLHEDDSDVLMPFARLDSAGNLQPIPKGEFPYAVRGGNGFAVSDSEDPGAVAQSMFERVPIELFRNVFELSSGRTAFLAFHNGKTQLLRLDRKGKWDPEFRPILEFGNEPATDISVAEQPGGELIVSGTIIAVDGAPSKGVLRLLPNGAIDPAFRCVLISKREGHAPRVAVQKDGRIVLGGFFDSVNGEPARYLTRLNSDGSIDRAFHRRFDPTEQFPLNIPVVALSRSGATSEPESVTAASTPPHDPGLPLPAEVRIIGMEITAEGAVILKVQAQPGRRYVLQASKHFDNPAWENVSTILQTTAGDFELRDPDAAQDPSRFYRIAVE